MEHRRGAFKELHRRQLLESPLHFVASASRSGGPTSPTVATAIPDQSADGRHGVQLCVPGEHVSATRTPATPLTYTATKARRHGAAHVAVLRRPGCHAHLLGHAAGRRTTGTVRREGDRQRRQRRVGQRLHSIINNSIIFTVPVELDPQAHRPGRRRQVPATVPLLDDERDVSSTDIADYNTFIQTRAAAGHTDIRAYSAGFRVVGCTAAVDARDNT